MPGLNIPEAAVGELEKMIFESINTLIRDGAVFLGNFWVNHPEKGGYFEIRLSDKGEVIIFESNRCHPRMFGPSF